MPLPANQTISFPSFQVSEHFFTTSFFPSSLANSGSYAEQLEAVEEQMKTKYENGEIAKEQYETAKVMIDLAMSGITGMLAFGKTGQEKKNNLV